MRNVNNLGKHELIGLKVQVSRESSPDTFVFEGRVVDETMNTFVIEHGDRQQQIPKHSHIFHFNLDNNIIKMNGDRIRFRPEDRTKKVKRLG